MKPRKTPRATLTNDTPVRRFRWAIAVGLIAVTVAAYTPVWQFDFIAVDDPQYVSENPHVAGGLTASGIAWAFTTGHESNWHPLTWISHQLDVTVAGVDPGPHHLVNLVLHVANVLLLLTVVLRLTGHYWRSVFVAAIFAVHPLHVESVAWIAERKDLLSALFFILAIGAYERYVRTGRRSYVAGVAVLFALGLMAKPMVVTLPFVLLLLDGWPLGRMSSDAGVARRLGSLVAEKLPLFALATAAAIVTFVVQQRGGAVGDVEAFPLSLRLANAVVSAVDYLGDTVWPSGLGMFYPFPASIPSGRFLVAASILLGLSAFAVALRRRAPFVLSGWLWWLGMLVPVIGLVQVGTQARADRYMYLPIVGLSVAIVWGVAALASRWPTRTRTGIAAIAAVAIAACAVATHAQVAHWRDAVSIATRTAAVTDHLNNFGVHYGLAEYLRAHGRSADAIAHYEEAIRRQPNFAEAHAALAWLLARNGRMNDAIPHFQHTVRLQPQRAEAHRDLASALAAEGRFAEAEPEFSEAFRLGLESADVRYQHGLVLATLGRIDDAIVQFSAAVRLSPTLLDAHLELARAYARVRRYDDSVRELKEVLRLDPTHAEARAALSAAGR